MNPYKISKLYLQFIIYEIYYFWLNFKKIIKLGVLNYIRFFVLRKDVIFSNQHINDYLKKNYSKWKKIKNRKKIKYSNKIIVYVLF